MREAMDDGTAPAPDMGDRTAVAPYARDRTAVAPHTGDRAATSAVVAAPAGSAGALTAAVRHVPTPVRDVRPASTVAVRPSLILAENETLWRS